MTEPTHYEVLAIPKSLIEDTNKEQIPKIIKQAYHRALLRHHPDKTNTPHRTTAAAAASTTTPPTVDQIALAYTTLSCPAERAAYNRQLVLARNPTSAPGDNSAAGGSTTFQTGIETIDLDDLDYSEAGATTRWHRSCRCGNEEGFAFGEDDLEEAGDLGELIVGCQDCSLWLRVCFAVVEDDVDDGVGGGGGGSGGGVVESDGVSSKDEISRGGPLGHAAQSTGQPG
ncbi:hypothetical protein N8I77_004027 [Diaporthe amygdali]|uniref:Diphthamide biosynthesis protein 4 n=1 Tax=Phomopsis amygdali TaxID=1214568 RepID=A0AAD9SL55_PHOAM|nr:hypothetical protein N8I77_004027 [Diaporthe amygdali]